MSEFTPVVPVTGGVDLEAAVSKWLDEWPRYCECGNPDMGGEAVKSISDVLANLSQTAGPDPLDVEGLNGSMTAEVKEWLATCTRNGEPMTPESIGFPNYALVIAAFHQGHSRALRSRLSPPTREEFAAFIAARIENDGINSFDLADAIMAEFTLSSPETEGEN